MTVHHVGWNIFKGHFAAEVNSLVRLDLGVRFHLTLIVLTTYNA